MLGSKKNENPRQKKKVAINYQVKKAIMNMLRNGGSDKL